MTGLPPAFEALRFRLEPALKESRQHASEMHQTGAQTEDAFIAHPEHRRFQPEILLVRVITRENIQGATFGQSMNRRDSRPPVASEIALSMREKPSASDTVTEAHFIFA